LLKVRPRDGSAPVFMASNTTPLWLFDLDNTLHNASHAIFPAINTNMNRIIKRVLDNDGQPSDEAAVNYLRRHYWKLYGATLLGWCATTGWGWMNSCMKRICSMTCRAWCVPSAASALAVAVAGAEDPADQRTAPLFP
jgi:FMN phosphatase YigB (HAD superfamily)